jgi:hypothetical protein
MSIGVDFILRANSATFTKAMAGVNNSVKDLKKSFRDFDVGNGFKQALGVGGIIQGFRLAITNAQNLRDELEKMGRPVDDATRSVAAYGDALDDAWQGSKNLATTTLSFFTRAGEGWGMVINRLRGVTAQQEKLNEASAKGADKQEAQAAEAKKNMKVKGERAEVDFESQQRKNALDAMTTNERRNALLAERTQIFQQMDGMVEGSDAWKVKRAEGARLSGDINALGRDIQTRTERETADAEKEQARKEKEKADEAKKIRDQFAPSVEQLAEMSAGGFASQNDPRLRARKILEKERFAAEAGGRGDFAGAIKLGTEAQQMRKSLESVSGAGTALTAETAEVALRAALDTTNKELQGVREQLKGLIKAQ